MSADLSPTQLRLNMLDLASRVATGDNVVRVASDMLAFVTGDSPSPNRETEEALTAARNGATKTFETTEAPMSDLNDSNETIDAGTGKPTEDQPTKIRLTTDGVKTMTVKLVQAKGGKDKLKAILAKYGAAKFSEVPGDKLAVFAQDLVEAGVPLPA